MSYRINWIISWYSKYCFWQMITTKTTTTTTSKRHSRNLASTPSTHPVLSFGIHTRPRSLMGGTDLNLFPSITLHNGHHLSHLLGMRGSREQHYTASIGGYRHGRANNDNNNNWQGGLGRNCQGIYPSTRTICLLHFLRIYEHSLNELWISWGICRILSSHSRNTVQHKYSSSSQNRHPRFFASPRSHPGKRRGATRRIVYCLSNSITADRVNK